MEDSFYYDYVIWGERGYILWKIDDEKGNFLKGKEKDSCSISSSSDKSNLPPHRS